MLSCMQYMTTGSSPRTKLGRLLERFAFHVLNTILKKNIEIRQLYVFNITATFEISIRISDDKFNKLYLSRYSG
jgi:hypothetical protein